MQEEITQKTLALCVEASKMTAQLLQQAIKKVLADMEKHKKNPQLRHGKQTLRQLMKHNTGVSNIEITDQNKATNPGKTSRPEKNPLDAKTTYHIGNRSFVVEPVFKEESPDTLGSVLLRLMKSESEKL